MGDTRILSLLKDVIFPRYGMTDVNEYVPSFMKTVKSVLGETFPETETLIGMEQILKNLPFVPGITEENKKIVKDAHQEVYAKLFPSAPAAGGKRRYRMPRKMTRKYCKKTPCKKMGFTQRASCRPWKNCYKNKK